MRKTGVAVKTLEFDVSLVDFVAPDVDVPLISLAGGRLDERRVCFVTVFSRRVRGVSRSEKASQVPVQPMLGHRTFRVA